MTQTTTTPTVPQLRRLLDRARVIASSAVTYLTIAGGAVAFVLEELVDVPNVPDWLVSALAVIAGAIISAIAVIRRVTPVLESARGILDNGQPRTDLEAIGAAVLRNAIDKSRPSELEQYPGEFP